MVINNVLCFILPILTNFEKQATKTSYECSVAFKLSLSLFLNSGIIPVVTYKRETYFTDGGFLMSVWMNWLCICILTPLMELFDVVYLFSLFKWSRLRGQKENCTLTQQEANIALEPYEVSMISKFSQTINMMFYTAFYVIFFPPGILITLAGLILQYWVSKVGFCANVVSDD